LSLSSKKYVFGILDPRSEIRDPRYRIRKKPIPDPGSRGQKGTGSRIRNTANRDPDPIQIQGFSDQKLKKKITAEKKLNLFGSKTTIYLSLGLHKERPSYRRILQISKENIQQLQNKIFFIFKYFCGSFLPSWIRIRIHWPD
jgi:hypothetical protein